jgi:hypothetical protein
MKTELLASTLSLALTCAGVIAAPISLPVAARQQPAIAQFHQNVQDYQTLHEEAAATLPPRRVARSGADLVKRTAALAQAIRDRRPEACDGDIFAPEVQKELRRRIGLALRAQGVTGPELVTRLEREVVPGGRPPVVNEPFAWQLGAMMPPYLLAALPRLPAVLQYRLVGRDLILLDIDANLVVDILRDAVGAWATAPDVPPTTE